MTLGLSELLEDAVPMLDLKYHSGHSFFLVLKDQEAERNQSNAVIIERR